MNINFHEHKYNGKTSRYIYDHASERVMKSHGFYLLANEVIKPCG